MSNSSLDRRDWFSVTTAQRILGGISASMLTLLAVAAAVAALIPDALPGVGDRVAFALVALLALAGAVVLIVELIRS
jgi:hypothetical protein